MCVPVVRKMDVQAQPTTPLQPPPMVISQQDYVNNASHLLLAECCLAGAALQACQREGGVVIDVRTRGEDNVVGYVPGYRRLYKHIFLQQKDFKQRIVDHYRALGFGWVDVVPLNRVDWKIFVWPRVENK